MKTTLPISTISYNTCNYLRDRLDDLRKSHHLAFYAFITHKPEEEGEKFHHHVYLEPAKPIQTEDLREVFKELDPNNSIPLGCQPFRKSKFDDWYLYSIHDPDYLLIKQEVRHISYDFSDVRTDDVEYLKQLVSEINLSRVNPYADLRLAYRQGMSVNEYILSRNIPFRLVNPVVMAWNSVVRYASEKQKKADSSVDLSSEFVPDVALNSLFGEEKNES